MEDGEKEMQEESNIIFKPFLRVKSELLVQIDGASQETDDDGNIKNVIILGATNLPWDLDTAIIRRLDKRIRKIIKLLTLKSRYSTSR